MVLKPDHPASPAFVPFENDVKMYGTQTKRFGKHHREWFENDVKMYGTQTCRHVRHDDLCLRMM